MTREEAIVILKNANTQSELVLKELRKVKDKSERIGMVGEYYAVLGNCVKEIEACNVAISALEEMEDNRAITIAECQVDTIKHIENVRKFIRLFTDKLTTRGIEHDKLKLESPEVEIFTEYTPRLATSTYGSEEYNSSIKEMNVALQHHYANYRHHPEHFDKGINDMNLVDIVEMLCDWKAATMRHNDGNLLKSIELNAKRFGYDDQLKQIFINTAKMFDEQ